MCYARAFHKLLYYAGGFHILIFHSLVQKIQTHDCNLVSHKIVVCKTYFVIGITITWSCQPCSPPYPNSLITNKPKTEDPWSPCKPQMRNNQVLHNEGSLSIAG